MDKIDIKNWLPEEKFSGNTIVVGLICYIRANNYPALPDTAVHWGDRYLGCLDGLDENQEERQSHWDFVIKRIEKGKKGYILENAFDEVYSELTIENCQYLYSDHSIYINADNKRLYFIDF